jgi:hypothetical protein
MAMGRSDAVQGDLMATWAEMPRSPGHAFYKPAEAKATPEAAPAPARVKRRARSLEDA